MKEALAKSFCTTFIQYQKPMDVPSKTPWVGVFSFCLNYTYSIIISKHLTTFVLFYFQSHIHAPGGSGHFGNIFKRIQGKLPASERKRKAAKKPKPANAQPPSDSVNVCIFLINFL